MAWQATTSVTLALVIGFPIGIVAGRWVWDLFADWLGILPHAIVPVVAIVASVPVAVLLANAIAALPAPPPALRQLRPSERNSRTAHRTDNCS